MKISDLINSIKEFFLDFLGYFAPGFFLLILLDTIVNDEFKVPVSSFFQGESKYVVFAFIAYIIGYMIYSISESFINKYLYIVNKFGKDDNKFLKRFKIANRQLISSKISVDGNFELCKKKLKDKWTSDGLSKRLIKKRLHNINGRDLRNLLMSYIPETDTKIYTFMFRSDLSKHLAFISFTLGFIALTFVALDFFWFDISVFKTDRIFIVIYFTLIFAAYYLAKTYSTFLSIAYRIPLSIFLAKELNNKEEIKSNNNSEPS